MRVLCTAGRAPENEDGLEGEGDADQEWAEALDSAFHGARQAKRGQKRKMPEVGSRESPQAAGQAAGGSSSSSSSGPVAVAAPPPPVPNMDDAGVVWVGPKRLGRISEIKACTSEHAISVSCSRRKKCSLLKRFKALDALSNSTHRPVTDCLAHWLMTDAADAKEHKGKFEESFKGELQ